MSHDRYALRMIIGASLAVSCARARAADHFWQDDGGTLDGSWSNGANWNLGTPPPPGNSAFISAPATGPYVVSLDVNPSGLLSFTHNSGTPATST